MSSANQLFLLADHIKLSLLERRRAQTLHLDDDSAGHQDDAQDGHISRSLDQFRSGLATLRQEQTRLEDANDASAASAIADALPSLQKQLDDLTSQFHGFANPSSTNTLTSPNSASLAPDFAHATSTTTASKPAGSQASKPSKTVRFSDTPPSPRVDADADLDPERGELFGPYHDDPAAAASSGYRDQAQSLSNQQIHDYHAQILDEQDEHLDRLGASIGRQRELSLQIGDELDSHVAMLDDVDAAVDRHQTRLDRASRALGRVARRANDNKQITAIIVLIIILVLLIAILK